MIEMNDEQKRAFFQGWHDQWIAPELERRFGATGVPDNFKIRQCLILLPDIQKPIVQFNDEFGWRVENPKLTEGKTLTDIGIGNTIYLYDILAIDNVLAPTINDKRVAFMFLYWAGFEYKIFIDLLPLQPDYNVDDERFKFDGTVIAQYLQTILVEMICPPKN